VNRITASRGVALLIGLLVAADWTSKLWVTNRLALGETRSVVDGWLYFVHRTNSGVAFSMLSDLPDGWGVPLLTGFGLVGVYVFGRILHSTPDRIARIAAAMIIAGALGNMGDRLIRGEVTDFVLLAFFPFVFNIADTAITLGGSVLALRLAVASDSAAATPTTSTG
jgi:signal peptidase II